VQSDPAPARGSLTARPRPELIVNADWITARSGTAGLRLIDTRTLGEFNGTGNRSGMPSAGHLQGARNLEWEWLFREDQPLLLKDRAELRKLYGENITPTDAVVTYCWVGYRASATWFVARVLGYDAKFYDGSYQDWQRRKLPTTAGGTP
jgi:thiosulfate/3-mercaptopyruvate sulfurtransferase